MTDLYADGLLRAREASVLSVIGNTPLVPLDRMFAGAHFRVFGKLERCNPGGSVKDRPARAMIERGIAEGRLIPGVSEVVESSSGNLGIALAQVCNYYDLRFHCIVDARATRTNIALIRAYGGTVEVIDRPDPETGEYLPARIRRVQQICGETGAFWPNQYANAVNAESHHATIAEILRAVHFRLDYLFCTTSSCGTLRGCSDFLRAHGLETVIIGVDAAGSAIFGPQFVGEAVRKLPGHGAAIVPPLFAQDLADDVVHVTDAQAVRGCRRLLRTESILCGASSGAALAAISTYASRIPEGALCAAILPDGGDRYLDTIFDDDWVGENLNDETDEAVCA
ncbi:2,3-diaminopropionate biosynthesis protein SbnA [Tsukamurella pulmonis]|uniref:2,3-diaminopropionate biosynthesis protein SbnA n=1 Tax=Tsukamurella pulmonis TaxID=47312 RepID=UPI000794ABFF|nr:2,3-diaminopropionate biosynthesis protein SbnA [Tsukamurella pulmonis]KXP11217.1 2,3-diaminopropionate biosynthesis protein SbnA [Tsukamurella pulmonis]RDH13194.1 2,3-diaminopropionate biosynthesis protein SbnA [Tsukamurella pulmonis]